LCILRQLKERVGIPQITGGSEPFEIFYKSAQLLVSYRRRIQDQQPVEHFVADPALELFHAGQITPVTPYDGDLVPDILPGPPIMAHGSGFLHIPPEGIPEIVDRFAG